LKIRLKIIVDLLLLITGLINIITGLLILLDIAAGPGRYSERIISITELSSKGIAKLIHNYTGIIIISLVFFHLLLNWRTILCYFRMLFKKSGKTGILTCESNDSGDNKN
jgi:cytochrome b subunit of formate dehydrogenase